MKKLTSFLSVICVINVLMLAGLAGFLWGTGRLDKPKAQAIGDLLRQPGSPEGLREKLYDIMVPATSPATASAPASHAAVAHVDGAAPASAQERIDYVRRIIDVERLRLEVEAQKLREQQNMLVSKQNQLDLEVAALAARKKAYEQSLAGTTTQADTAGFEKSMTLFDELKPKQVKELLVAMPAEQVARYLSAMEPDRAAKIISEFKTPDEKILLNRILDKVRGVSVTSGTGAASTLPATSQPVAIAADRAGS